MPQVEYDGEIVVVDSPDAACKALSELSKASIVGFDTETRPSFQKGKRHNVALVQISSGATTYLFRVNRLGFLPEMKEFMENQSILKIGLSLKDDFNMLHRSDDFTPGGFIDLQAFVRQYSIVDASLQRIYAIIFGGRISKGQRLSNWEASELTSAQQKYAAIDAWACLRIYNYLLAGKFDPEQSPYRLLPEANPKTNPETKPGVNPRSNSETNP